MLKEIGAGLSSYNQYDLDVTDTASQWLQDRAAQRDDKPWVLMVGLVAPHFPLVVPQEYLDHYPLDQVPDSKLLPADGYQHHPWIAAKNRFKCDEDRFNGDPALRRLAIASYYGLCSFLDHNIGQILGTLDQTGLSSETVVIYSSDHGDNLGARALWGKSNMYRESVDVPMIVAGPDIPRGAVNETPVSLTDIHATILDGVGIDASTDPIADDGVHRDSTSLLSLVNTPGTDRTCMSQYHAVGADNGAFMVTDGKMKYHAYVGYEPELFNLDEDPEEVDNLALDSARSDECQAWHEKLEAHLGGRSIDSVDRLAKDDQAALIERFGGREAALAVGGTPGATPVPGGKHE
jgi:choline-sulfatase